MAVKMLSELVCEEVVGTNWGPRVSTVLLLDSAISVVVVVTDEGVSVRVWSVGVLTSKVLGMVMGQALQDRYRQ